MAKQSLLVADADPRSLRILEVALRKAGFSVGTATDGAEALRRIQRTPPDLVLSEVTLPNQDGLTLCRAVRAEARIAGMPFLLMSAEKGSAVKSRAIEAGADDFLGKPLLIKELVQRVRMLLARRDEAKYAQRETPAALTGAVGDLGLVDLFQSLDNWKKSATVTCESDGRNATVWVRDGQVIDAEAGPLVAEAAFHRLLNWDTGTFRVEFGLVDRDARLDLGTQGLLMEGMRRIDEIGRVLEVLPVTTVLSVDFPALASRLADLPDEINGVVKLIDARRTLREVIEESPIDELSTLGVVQKLLADGVLRQGNEPKQPRQKPSLEQWLSAPVATPSPIASAQVVQAPMAAPAPAAKAKKKGVAIQPSTPVVLPVPLPATVAAAGPAAPDLEATQVFAEPAPTQASLFSPSDDSPRAAAPEAEEPPPAAPPEVTRTATFSLPKQAETALELVRFPPLRGVRRERLRREADEARASLSSGHAVRLSRVLELPGWADDGVDALGEARRISPAVGEAAKRFAPDVPIARLHRGALQMNGGAQAAKGAAPWDAATQPGYQPAGQPSDERAAERAALDEGSRGLPAASAARTAHQAAEAAETVRDGEGVVPLVEPAAAAPIAAAVAATVLAPAALASSEPAASEPAASEPAASEPAASETAASEPAASETAASESAAPAQAAAESIAALPAGELPVGAPIAALSPEPVAAAQVAPIESLVAPEASAVALPAAAEPPTPHAAPQPEPAIAAAAEPVAAPLPAGPAAEPMLAEPDVERPPAGLAAPAVAPAEPVAPLPSAPRAAAKADLAATSADDEFEAELRAALGGKRKRWPYVAAAAVAVVALFLFLRQPSTDKKDAPWLDAQTKPAAPPAAAQASAPAMAPPTPAPPPALAEQKPGPAEPTKPVETALSAKPSPSVVSTASLVPDLAATDDYAKLLASGEALLKRGKYKAAVSEFKRAVGLNPESVPALLALGDAFLEADAPRNAVKPLEKAAKLDARSGRAQLLLGTAFQSLGKNPEAVKAYQRYLELESSGEFAHDVRSILANLQR